MTGDRSDTPIGSRSDPGRLDLHAGPRGSPRDERKLVTVLFADMAGFTDFAEALDPEAVRDVLNGLFDVLVPCVERNLGSIDKFLGDSLMAVFGAPVTHPDDAERAVRAALEMGRAIASFNEARGTSFAIHIGINTGRVVAGSIGGADRLEYTVIGDAVNVAKRLEEASAPGEILLGPATRRLVAASFDTESAGEIAGGGRAQQVQAYRVVGDAHENAGRLADVAGLTGFVGRVRALAVIERRLALLEQGRSGALFVSGDPGIGKSRLVREARQRWGDRTVQWLEGRGVATGHSLSYSPLAQMVLADAGVRPSDGAQGRLERIESRLCDLFGSSGPELMPAGRAFLGLPNVAPASRFSDGPDGGGLKAEVLAWFREYLAALARRRPLVLVLDDVQWFDQSSVEALAHLLEAGASARTLFLIVSRAASGTSESRLLKAARSTFADEVASIRLDPLSPGETEELVQSMLGRDSLPVALGRVVNQRAAGNPLFAEEIVRHLVDVQALVRSKGGQWILDALAEDLMLPDSVEGVIAARVDALPDGPKRCLGVAAVLGRSFDRRVLAAMDDDALLDGHLAELGVRSLIRARSSAEPTGFIFTHALVRETAYESLLRKRRRDLHLRAARALEQVFPHRLEEHAGVLAYHYTRAEQWEQARYYLVLAGERSAGIAGDAEAVTLYREAMGALLKTFDETWKAPHGEDPVEWLLARIEPFYQARQLGELIDALEPFYDKVLASCGPADARTLAAASVLGAAYLHKGMLLEAVELLSAALRDRDPATDEYTRPVTRGLIALGNAQLRMWQSGSGDHGLVEALGTLESALKVQLGASLPDPQLLGECYLWVSSARYRLGDLRSCRELIEEALRSPVVLAGPNHVEIMLNLSNSLVLAGDLEEAAHWAERCLSGAGSSYVRALAEQHLGIVCHARGDFTEAERRFEISLSLLETLARDREAAETVLFLAETYLQGGRIAAARETVARAVRLIDSVEGPRGWHMPRAMWTLAGVELAEGRLDESERLLLEGEKMAQGIVADSDPFWSELFFRRALVRRRLCRQTEAELDFHRATALLRSSWGDDHPQLRAMRAEWAPSAASVSQ